MGKTEARNRSSRPVNPGEDEDEAKSVVGELKGGGDLSRLLKAYACSERLGWRLAISRASDVKAFETWRSRWIKGQVPIR